MPAVNAAKEKLFRKLKSGDTTAFYDTLEGERVELYDYLMRMTGQISRSADTIDEVYASLSSGTIDEIDSYAELKICLYTTARKFNADIWNADTSRLLNAALDGPFDAADVSERASRERQQHKPLDRALSHLPGREREAIVLSLRVGFTDEEIGEIVGASTMDVAAHIASGLRALAAAVGTPDVDAGLQQLPGHPLPIRSSQATINLSEVMQGIKTKPVGLSSPTRIALFALMIGIVVACYLYPGALKRLVELVRTGGSGG